MGKAVERLKSCPITLLVIAVVIGITSGLLLSSRGFEKDGPAITILALPGKLWLKALKCVVLPMIIFSMVDAMVMLRSLPGARYLGLLVVGIYLTTTVLAALEGCFVSATILDAFVYPVRTAPMDKMPVAKRSLLQTIVGIFENLVPKNVVNDAATNNLLPVIVASIIFGLLVQSKNEDGGESVTMKFVKELNDVVVKVIAVLMTITPIGVASLVFGSAARLDLAAMGHSVGLLFLATIAGLLMQALIVYPLLIVLVARRNPCTYFVNVVPALATALGTSSSAATLPVSISCAVERNGISDYVANFVLSLGATINMDGTTIYLICATCFLGRLHGVEFLGDKYLLLIILATLSSMGSAPIPSASLVLLATILTAVDVPLDETFGLITAVDWMLDRLRTCVNVFGDSCATAIVDHHSSHSHASLGKSEDSSTEGSEE